MEAVKCHQNLRSVNEMRGKMHKRILLQNSSACQWIVLPTRDVGEWCLCPHCDEQFVTITSVLNLLLACYAETLIMDTIGRDREENLQKSLSFMNNMKVCFSNPQMKMCS